MPMPITPELAVFMRSLGYDQLRQAYKEKYGKPYPMFCLSETKISGAEYMEELRAQFPGEDLDELIERYTDHRSEEEKRAELDALVDELVRRQNRHAP